MINQIMMQGLLNQLQRNNPQAYGVIQQAMRGGSNPADLFKQITKGYSKDQLNNLYAQAKQYGISDDVINQVRY